MAEYKFKSSPPKLYENRTFVSLASAIPGKYNFGIPEVFSSIVPKGYTGREIKPLRVRTDKDFYGAANMPYSGSSDLVLSGINHVFGSKGYAKNPLVTGLEYGQKEEIATNKTDLSRGRWEFN